MKSYTISWGNHRLELGTKTSIMGVVNVTPDSFSDGGHFYETDAAIAQGLALAQEGADILDIGGESTRPFSESVPAAVEMERVIPVIRGLAEQLDIPISIDTTKSEVAEKALAAGASIINDVGALRMDPEMGSVAARYGVPVILMHMKGTPKTMQVSPVYDDLMGEISRFLEEAIQRATDSGVDRDKIIIDPGIGFGKTLDHNLSILANLRAFEALDAPILVGSSRKAFIRKLLKKEEGQELPVDHPDVETGTQSSVAAAILNGAHIVRVHHVSNTCSTARIADAIRARNQTIPEQDDL
jgi:dihydropteroate synthase